MSSQLLKQKFATFPIHYTFNLNATKSPSTIYLCFFSLLGSLISGQLGNNDKKEKVNVTFISYHWSLVMQSK